MTLELTVSRTYRLRRVASAFVRQAFHNAISYPFSFVIHQFRGILPVFIYFFVARLVNQNGSSVGGDYFTFVVIGVICLEMMTAGLQGFTTEFDRAINQGRVEAYLAEPIPWRALPLGMAQWPTLSSAGGVVLISLIAIALGADFRAPGLPAAILILLLGTLASLSVAIVSAAGKILSKHSDPILLIYQLVAALLSGVYFPITVLPSWLRFLSWCIPHTYVLSATRQLLMPEGGEIPGLSASGAIMGLIAFNFILYPLALWIFGRALEVGRRLGILGGY